MSSGVPTAWTWEFDGATPALSTDKDPSGILYETVGTFRVKLTVSNEAGIDSLIYEEYITVSDTLVPEVAFYGDRTNVCTNGIVHFTDSSMYCPNAWEWSFVPGSISYKEGTTANSQHPIVEFRQSGIYTVTLTVTNANGEAELTKTDYIEAGGYDLPFEETFETGGLEERNWSVLNPDFGFTWADHFIESTGNNTALMKFYGYFKLGERDGLVSPYLNFSQFSNVYLTFDHAYAQRFSQRDSLVIYISVGCEDNWQRIWANGPDGNGIFETAPSTPYEFEPAGFDDWCGMGWGAECFTLDLSQWAGEDNVKIMFEGYNNLGNNLYLDNIVVSNTTGSTDIRPADGTFTLFPNPGNGLFTISAAGIKGLITLEVTNSQGQIVYQDHFSQNRDLFQKTVNLTRMAGGVYFVKLVSGENVQIRKVIIE
jgi:PKD repeat protein